jgi:hypothetical protein
MSRKWGLVKIWCASTYDFTGWGHRYLFNVWGVHLRNGTFSENPETRSRFLFRLRQAAEKALPTILDTTKN